MNLPVKCILTFVVTFVGAVIVGYIMESMRQEPFSIDLAFTFGVAAAATVLMFVHELTKDEE